MTALSFQGHRGAPLFFHFGLFFEVKKSNTLCTNAIPELINEQDRVALQKHVEICKEKRGPHTTSSCAHVYMLNWNRIGTQFLLFTVDHLRLCLLVHAVWMMSPFRGSTDLAFCWKCFSLRWTSPHKAFVGSKISKPIEKLVSTVTTRHICTYERMIHLHLCSFQISTIRLK